VARIRPAKLYAKPNSAMRTIARVGASQVRASLKAALKALPDMIDHAKMVELIRHGRARDIAHTAIDWHHFRQVLRHPYERLARTYEAGAKLGERKINGAFAARRRGVRYSKVGGAGRPRVNNHQREEPSHQEPSKEGSQRRLRSSRSASSAQRYGAGLNMPALDLNSSLAQRMLGEVLSDPRCLDRYICG
jgi:hypothetical protein